MDYMWGHHPAFGAPFLGPDCRVDLPAGELLVETFNAAAGTRLHAPGDIAGPWWTKMASSSIFSRPDAPGIGHEDLAYVINLPEGWYAITKSDDQSRLCPDVVAGSLSLSLGLAAVQPDVPAILGMGKSIHWRWSPGPAIRRPALPPPSKTGPPPPSSPAKRAMPNFGRLHMPGQTM